MGREIRLYISQETLNSHGQDKILLGEDIKIAKEDHNYLINVLRKIVGDKINIFDGLTGEYCAEIIKIEKKSLTLRVISLVRELEEICDINLVFALIKNSKLELIAKKATELGLNSFFPITTTNNIVKTLNKERFFANIKEACEQCNRNNIAHLNNLMSLENFLNYFEEKKEEKILIFCNETENDSRIKDLVKNVGQKSIYILIGPEGGFTQSEINLILRAKDVYSVTLGKQILTAETAIISAIAIVKEFIN